MKIYLDDERKTPDGWIRVYTVPQLIRVFKQWHKTISAISIDNSLGCYPDGSERLQGIKFLQWLENRIYTGSDYKIPLLSFHSTDVSRWKEAQSIIQNLNRAKEP